MNRPQSRLVEIGFAALIYELNVECWAEFAAVGLEIFIVEFVDFRGSIYGLNVRSYLGDSQVASLPIGLKTLGGEDIHGITDR